MPLVLMCLCADERERKLSDPAYPAPNKVQKRITGFCGSIESLEPPSSMLQTGRVPPLSLAEALERYEAELQESLQQDLTHLKEAPASVLFVNLTAVTTEASDAVSAMLQAQDVFTGLQSAVPKVTGLPHKFKSLLQQLEATHLKEQTTDVALSLHADSWTASMVNAFKEAFETFKDFPDALSSLMQSMTKLAAMGMCAVVASTNLAPALASEDAVSVKYDHLIDQLHANMLINTDNVWQTHAQVQLLRGVAAKMMAQKQQRSKLLSDAHKLLASTFPANIYSNDSISAALASVSSQQHGMVVIGSTDGVLRFSSLVTTVDFGTVLSNTGTVLRTIRLVNNCTVCAHIKVSV